ncbi:hypothetical protein GCM10023078_44090 [Gibbsiella greigii]
MKVTIMMAISSDMPPPTRVGVEENNKSNIKTIRQPVVTQRTTLNLFAKS